MNDKADLMDYTDDIDELCEDMDGLMDMSDLDDVPTAIIVTNVPAVVFSDEQSKACFENLFLDLDAEATFVYLRNFKRVRIQFSNADAAGIARIKNDGVHILDQPIRCYFFQLRTVPNEDDNHLKLPERTKMFLISPPASPPVGWESVPEAEPVVNYDLLHAIASLNPGETHEVHAPSVDAPAIVVHLCEDPVGFSPGRIAQQKIVQTRRPGPSARIPPSDKQKTVTVKTPQEQKTEKGKEKKEDKDADNEEKCENEKDTQEEEADSASDNKSAACWSICGTKQQ